MEWRKKKEGYISVIRWQKKERESINCKIKERVKSENYERKYKVNFRFWVKSKDWNKSVSEERKG